MTGRKLVAFPKGHLSKAELEKRQGPGFARTAGAKPPEELSADGKRLWRRIVPELERLGILKQVSIGALIGTCTAYETAVQADREVRKHGVLVPAARGGLKSNPAIKIAHDAWTRYRAFCAEFGLSPASESRVAGAVADDGIDELERALCMRSPTDVRKNK
jgi:P27 family predicted phage terminase small subunit